MLQVDGRPKRHRQHMHPRMRKPRAGASSQRTRTDNKPKAAETMDTLTQYQCASMGADGAAVPGAERTLLYSFSRCCADVMADRTESRLTRDLILDAVPYSSESIFVTRLICISVAGQTPLHALQAVLRTQMA